MKKIGILTFYNTTNYGALLQMYALYQTLNNAGINASIIRYYCEAVEKRENLRVRDAADVKQLLRLLILKLPNLNKQKQFRKFEKEHFTYSESLYKKEDISGISKEYDEVIVGSDQVWNLNLTENDFGYFLKDVRNIKKVSYAVSFGTETLSDNILQTISPLLKEFDFISVREVSGIEIVKKSSGKDAMVVLDPTFLLSANEWNVLAEKPVQTSRPYVLLYLIQNKKQTINYAKKIAKKYGWDIKYVNISPYYVPGVHNIRSAAPTTFLQLIRDANLVITGSYHGLALSINFSKPVYYELNRGTQNYNARISSLISTLKMEKCQLDYNCIDIPQPDYKTIQGVVNEMRVKSKEALFFMCERL